MQIPSRASSRLALAFAAIALSCGGGGGGGTCDLGGGEGTAGAYHIELRYLTPLTEAQKAAFQAAATRIEEIVTASPSSVAVTWDAATRDVCLVASGQVPASETIGGLVVFASVEDLGSSGILAQSGPCLVRSSSHLPLAGVMIFNSNYIDGLSELDLGKTVLHEMLHTLGFGTMWKPPSVQNGFGWDLLSRAGATGASFTGNQALCGAKGKNSAPQAWTTVPVEDCQAPPPGDTCGGPTGEGTRDAHWRWAMFHDELMTGWIVRGRDQPLSATTVASLQDIGYTVDMSKVDVYAVPSGTAARSLEAAPPGFWMGDDVLHVRPVEVDEAAAP